MKAEISPEKPKTMLPQYFLLQSELKYCWRSEELDAVGKLKILKT